MRCVECVRCVGRGGVCRGEACGVCRGGDQFQTIREDRGI